MTRSLANVTTASELTHHMPRPDHGQVKQVAWYRPRYLAAGEEGEKRWTGAKAKADPCRLLVPSHLPLLYGIFPSLDARVGISAEDTVSLGRMGSFSRCATKDFREAAEASLFKEPFPLKSGRNNPLLFLGNVLEYSRRFHFVASMQRDARFTTDDKSSSFKWLRNFKAADLNIKRAQRNPTIEQVYNGFCRDGNDRNHHSSPGEWKFGSPSLPLFNTVDSNDCPRAEKNGWIDEREEYCCARQPNDTAHRSTDYVAQSSSRPSSALTRGGGIPPTNNDIPAYNGVAKYCETKARLTFVSLEMTSLSEHYNVRRAACNFYRT
ncbi:hypothetical protein X777_09570 [Ooceraea biroi]|uniref:Uncharacterized protein n=1 Tax=Ooceraea biroi TaxID=2015173 RepID=A0A026W750_OOCBI|nr:hypothetical protein X777_09570 [Ooceraea biroi]